jgi:mono/diheme cytochrome c family protein
MTSALPAWMGPDQAAELTRVAEGVADFLLDEDPEIGEATFLQLLSAAEQPAWSLVDANTDAPADAVAALEREDLAQVQAHLRAAAVARFHARRGRS